MIRLKQLNSYTQFLNLYLAPCTTVDSGLQVVDSGLCQWDSGFLELYSGFQIPQAKFSRIRESGFLYKGRYTPKQDIYGNLYEKYLCVNTSLAV